MRLSFLILFVTICFATPNALADQNTLSDDTNTLTIKKLQLENKKLELDTQKTEQEMQQSSKLLYKVIDIIPFITALIAVIGLFMTISKQINETRRQRRQSFDEKFMTIIENLGSNENVLKTGAAISILSFLKPRYEEFHEQVFYLLTACLKRDQLTKDEVLRKILLHGFQQAIRIRAAKLREKNALIDDNEDKEVLDLSGCELEGVNLKKLELNWCNASHANLSRSNLREGTFHRINASGANMRELRAPKAYIRKGIFDNVTATNANFNGAELIFCHFNGDQCNLAGADFMGSKLQSSHFKKANLKNAQFTGADLNDAHFHDAIFNTRTLETIIKADHWRQAHFNEEVMAQLQEIQNNINEKHSAQDKE